MSEEKRIKKLPVVEYFGPTVQGEGYMVGVRTSFLRMGLCDYACGMCDSMHAVDPVQVKANATWMVPDEIVEALKTLHFDSEGNMLCNWTTFSGGNPCIHDLTNVVLGLQDCGIRIAVETQGTFKPEWLNMCDVITVSPKSPGMLEKFEADKFARFVMTFQHHKGFNIKVVLFSQQDVEFLKSVNDIVLDINHDLHDRIYASLGNPYPPGQVPVDMTDGNLKLELLTSYRILAEDMLQDWTLRNVKFLPQLHVLAWANLQGV